MKYSNGVEARVGDVDVQPIPLTATGFAVYRFTPDRQYTPIHFANGYQSCEIFYRRLKVFGCLSDKENAAGICDVLDVNGDSIDSFYLNSKGLKYCYKKLDLRVVRSNPDYLRGEE